jgi:hypothetical protein
MLPSIFGFLFLARSCKCGGNLGAHLFTNVLHSHLDKAERHKELQHVPCGVSPALFGFEAS